MSVLRGWGWGWQKMEEGRQKDLDGRDRVGRAEPGPCLGSFTTGRGCLS